MSFFALQFGLSGLFMVLDSLVYWLLSKLFSLFSALAGADIIQASFFEDVLDKIYVVIGIFMLFVIAYSLLKSLIEPDNIAKNSGKLVINTVISLLLLGIVPSIFNYARNLQNIIIEEKVIENIIAPKNANGENIKGTSISLNILTSFLQIDDSIVGETSNDYVVLNPDGSISNWGDLKNAIEAGAENNFLKIGYWAEAVHDEKGFDRNGNEVSGVSYIPLVSTLAGLFLCYVMFSFCIDLGIRVVKLVFYQIIAPIPILLRILPEKKSVFDNWVKGTIATYLEVFIRIFIISLVSWITTAIFTGNVISLNNDVGIYGTILIVLGLYAFAKQAPKLISDITGIDSGNIKLGIGGKLAAGGAFGLAAMLFGGAQAGTQALTHGLSNTINAQGWKNVKNATGFKNKAKAVGLAAGGSLRGLFYTPFGIPVGLASGAFNSAKGGFSAKNFKDTSKAVSEGVENAVKARDKREAYRASNGIVTPISHVADAVSAAGKWAGISSSADTLKKTLEVYQKGFDFKKQLEDLALKKSTQAKVYDQQIEALNQSAIKREDFTSESAYSAALVARAEQINKLKDAKSFEIMKEINEKLGDIKNPKNAEYAEIVTAFDTYKRQNANLLNSVKDLTNEGWNPQWNDITEPLLREDLKDLVSNMKKEFRYTSNHSILERNKNETARAYAEFIQKENEKK